MFKRSIIGHSLGRSFGNEGNSRNDSNISSVTFILLPPIYSEKNAFCFILDAFLLKLDMHVIPCQI